MSIISFFVLFTFMGCRVFIGPFDSVLLSSLKMHRYCLLSSNPRIKLLLRVFVNYSFQCCSFFLRNFQIPICLSLCFTYTSLQLTQVIHTLYKVYFHKFSIIFTDFPPIWTHVEEYKQTP